MPPRTASARAQVEVIGRGVSFATPRAWSGAEFQSQRVDDRPRDLVLDLEHLTGLSVEATGPQRQVVTNARELQVDPQVVARPEHGAFDEVIGPEPIAELRRISRRISEGERRRPGTNGQASQARSCVGRLRFSVCSFELTRT